MAEVASIHARPMAGLAYLVIDRPYLEQLRRNAYAMAQQYSWARIAGDNLVFYKEALCQKRGV